MFGMFGMREYSDQEDVRRNFLINVSEGALYSLAMTFLSLQTILPVFVKKAGARMWLWVSFRSSGSSA